MFHVPIFWKLLNPIFSVIFFRFEPCFCCFESHFFRWSPFPLKDQVWPPIPIAIRRIVLNTSRHCRQMKHILNREIGKTCSHIFKIHPNEVKQKLSPQKQTRSTTSWTMFGFLWKKQGVPINPHKFIEVPYFPIETITRISPIGSSLCAVAAAPWAACWVPSRRIPWSTWSSAPSHLSSIEGDVCVFFAFC